MRKKTITLLLILILPFLSGCGRMYYENENTFVVVGGNIVNSRTIEIPAGTTVEFRNLSYNPLLWFVGSSIQFRNNGKLIARGTKDNPITFKLADHSISPLGMISFEGTFDESNVIEYCKFEKMYLEFENESTGKIEKCKFCDSSMTFRYDRCIVEFSSNTIIHEDTSVEDTQDLFVNQYAAPKFYYNEMNGGICCIVFSAGYGTPDIRYNNITNYENAAVLNQYYGSTYNIYDNYISSCAGKTGVAKDNSQCSGVNHTNPHSEPISGAGCGW